MSVFVESPQQEAADAIYRARTAVARASERLSKGKGSVDAVATANAKLADAHARFYDVAAGTIETHR
jgi:hypothetical protein